jgi:hypothetical protein
LNMRAHWSNLLLIQFEGFLDLTSFKKQVAKNFTKLGLEPMIVSMFRTNWDSRHKGVIRLSDMIIMIAFHDCFPWFLFTDLISSSEIIWYCDAFDMFYFSFIYGVCDYCCCE